MSETVPAVFGVQFTGDRWLRVAPSQIARGTFDRKELPVVDGVLGVIAVDAGPEKPAQRSNSAMAGSDLDRIWNFSASATR